MQWCTLDISNKESINKFAKVVHDEHGATVDVLINNAGVNHDITHDHSLDVANETISINFDGTTAMATAFLPLMRQPALKELGHSRIVNISSVGSKLSNIPSNRLRKEIRQAKSMQQAQSLRDSYLSSVADGTEAKQGWPKGKSYCVSKALINAWTQIAGAENPEVLVNACCPGWLKTDMGSLVGSPAKSTADGAKIPLKLAFGPINETGRYWENSSVYDTTDGQVAEWHVEGGS